MGPGDKNPSDTTGGERMTDDIIETTLPPEVQAWRAFKLQIQRTLRESERDELSSRPD